MKALFIRRRENASPVHKEKRKLSPVHKEKRK
jgi:hypothetical protein